VVVVVVVVVVVDKWTQLLVLGQDLEGGNGETPLEMPPALRLLCPCHVAAACQTLTAGGYNVHYINTQTHCGAVRPVIIVY